MARYTSWSGCSLRPGWVKATLDKCQGAVGAHGPLSMTCPSVGQALLSEVRQVRLKKALRLLSAAPVSVKQVAAEVGYKYASDLARHFKRDYGMTPTAWRRERVRLRP